MIDTLFYFVDTELEYRRLMQGTDGTPGISPTTIVFVGDSREIYVNGKGYGKTSTNGLLASSEFDTWKGHLNQRIDNAISGASNANAEARQKAEEDLAAAMETIQGILDDTSEEVSADILAVRQEMQQAKAQLQASIDSANLNADEILSELTTFQGTIRNELETSVRDAITNANGRTIWSELNTTNEGLTAVTNRIDKYLDANGDLKNTTVLQSIIDSGVRDNQAITDIQSKWAVMDENQDVIEWVASGFKSQSHNQGGLAAMFSSAQTDTQNAIAQAKTEAIQDAAGKYVATANLGASVIGIVEDELQVDSLSSLAMKSDITQATTTITNRLNTLDTTTGNLSTSLSLVSSRAAVGEAVAELLTDVDGNGTRFVSESKLDSAVNSMLATSGSSSAALIHQMAQADIAAVNIGAQIQNATAGLALQTSVDEVVDNLTGEIQARETAIAGLTAAISGTGGLSESIAAVEAKADANESSISQLSTWKDTTDSWKAGVITQTNKDGAIASLVASNSNSSTKQNLDASIVATVNDSSQIAIKADHIFVDAGKTTTIGSTYDPAQNGVNSSIAQLRTDVNNDHATLTALSSWKNDNAEAIAGLVTEAGLTGAMATILAKTNDASAAVTALVDQGTSSLTLSADKIYLAANETLANTIRATQGTIGGFDISSSNIHSGVTSMQDNAHNGVYLGTDGIKLGAGLFSVTDQGILTATNANITGAIHASSLELGAEVQLPASKVSGLSNAATDTAYNSFDPSKAVIEDNFKFTKLKDYASIPAVAKDGKIASATDYSDLPTIAKIGHGKFAELADYATAVPAVAKTGNYTDLTNKPTIPSKISDLLDDVTILKAADVTIDTATSSNGVTTKTIHFGNKEYTSIVDGNFVKTNVGLGSDTAGSTYTMISNDGLLTAKNAVIYGTIYANAGQVAGFTIAEPENAAANIHYGMTSFGDTEHDGVYLGTDGIALGRGNFSVDASGQLTAVGAAISGTVTATDGTIGGYTIDSDKLYVASDKSGFADFLGFSHANLTIEKNTPYERLIGNPYATHSSQFLQFISGSLGYFPSIQAVQRTINEVTEIGHSGAALDPETGLIIVPDESDDNVIQTKSEKIVQLSPIGFRTAIDTITNKYPVGDPSQITTTSKTFTETNRIDATGAGMLGKEGIKWTAAGAFTVSSGFAKSVFDSMQGGFSKTTSTGSGSNKVTTKNTVTPAYESIKLLKDITTASDGTTTTNAVEITPDAIKVTKNGTTSTGLTLDFTIRGIGYFGYDGKNHEYVATLSFTNGILTGCTMHDGYPGSTYAQVSSGGQVVIG